MKTNYTSFLAGGMLATLLVVTPLTSFAKEHERRDVRNESGCFKAFGHIIAPGWMKKNGTTTVSADCHLPFGIYKKLSGHSHKSPNNGNTATSTPDTKAPVISEISSRAGETHAEISWMTDEKSDGTVFLATTTPVVTSASTTKTIQKDRLVRDHRVILTNLTASTTYYVVVRSTDAAGNAATSSTFAVTTGNASADRIAPIITNVSAFSTSGTSTLSWKTNEPATSKVYFATTSPVSVAATSTQSVGTSTLSTNHSVTLTGLNATTTYYLLIESKDAAGNASTAGNLSIVTGM